MAQQWSSGVVITLGSFRISSQHRAPIQHRRHSSTGNNGWACTRNTHDMRDSCLLRLSSAKYGSVIHPRAFLEDGRRFGFRYGHTLTLPFQHKGPAILASPGGSIHTPGTAQPSALVSSFRPPCCDFGEDLPIPCYYQSLSKRLAVIRYRQHGTLASSQVPLLWYTRARQRKPQLLPRWKKGSCQASCVVWRVIVNIRCRKGWIVRCRPRGYRDRSGQRLWWKEFDRLSVWFESLFYYSLARREQHGKYMLDSNPQANNLLGLLICFIYDTRQESESQNRSLII